MGWFFRYFLPTLEKRHMSADVKVGKLYLIFQTIPRQLENQITFAHLATPLSARRTPRSGQILSDFPTDWGWVGKSDKICPP